MDDDMDAKRLANLAAWCEYDSVKDARPIWTDEQIAAIQADGKNLYALSRSETMLTKAHALVCGCPEDLANYIDADPNAKAIPGLWATLIALALQYGPQVWQIVAADLAAGKQWQAILTDLFGIVFPTLPPVPPVPVPAMAGS